MADSTPLLQFPHSDMAHLAPPAAALDLSNDDRKSLVELKLLLQESLENQFFIEDSPEELTIWGVPLMKDDRTDVILLKFLRASNFKVEDSFIMLKNTIKWRKEFNVDELLKEDLGDDFEKIVFMHGHDKCRHPVCYNVYGQFQNKELYNNEEKRMRFLRWRVQFHERSIRKLDFSAGGINTIFQVNDLKNSPWPTKKVVIATKQAWQILQDNYPEFVAKQVFINVPWWYMAFSTMISPFLTHRTRSKFVFAGPTGTAETLFKYILPEQVPIQYGGLSLDICECQPKFKPATVMDLKPATTQIVNIIVEEKCTLFWELRVIGWEVTYIAKFTPRLGDTVFIQEPKKIAPNDEPVVSDRFTVHELGDKSSPLRTLLPRRSSYCTGSRLCLMLLEWCILLENCFSLILLIIQRF